MGWLKWFFRGKRVCEHGDLFATLEDLGRTKVFWCGKCKAAIEVNGKKLVFSTKIEHN